MEKDNGFYEFIQMLCVFSYLQFDSHTCAVGSYRFPIFPGLLAVLLSLKHQFEKNTVVLR